MLGYLHRQHWQLVKWKESDLHPELCRAVRRHVLVSDQQVRSARSETGAAVMKCRHCTFNVTFFGYLVEQCDECVTDLFQPCVFPFNYKGQTFINCTFFDSTGRAWCATAVNDDGDMESRGNCDMECCKGSTLFSFQHLDIHHHYPVCFQIHLLMGAFALGYICSGVHLLCYTFSVVHLL